ncbi:MAG: outer membrane protein assembly factor BamB, partial [Betaproteobacteria bacterium]|nr:outer membrane protein assembly factor BamB [Betaproteobacteria bacterium]
MLLVTACSGTSRPKPADIAPVQVLQDFRQVWSADVGNIAFPSLLTVRDDRVALANNNGSISVLDVKTGKDIWRVSINSAVSAGVGFDGQQAAVVTRDNQLVVLKDAKVQWRYKMP